MLTFDEARHEYRIDGKLVPSVTQITSSLVDYSAVPVEVLNRKRDIGVALHKAVELYVSPSVEKFSLPESVRPYFEAFVKWLNESGFKPCVTEERVYSSLRLYAGTLDLIATSPKGRLALIDLKTTHSLMAATAIQTAAYAQAFSEMGECKIDERYALQLKKDGTYVFKQYKDKSDFTVFNSLLTVHHWKEAHNVKPTDSNLHPARSSNNRIGASLSDESKELLDSIP